MASLKELADLVISGDIEKVEAATQQLLDAGEDAMKVINEFPRAFHAWQQNSVPPRCSWLSFQSVSL